MADRLSATPLFALDAVVIDTETTTLEPALARVVELAGLKVAAGRIQQTESFHSLIDPKEPIPEIATRVHGIDAARVAGAPVFAEAWPRFLDYLGEMPVIGHTIGYDLTVLAHECERTGQAFHRPRTLDVRLLAEIVNPDLPGFSLEKLAAWLKVEVENRHSAAGDTLTAARIFVALVPYLREGGLRTFAEAEAACRKMLDAVALQHKVGWTDVLEAPARAATEYTFARIDAYPYRHRISEIMSSPPHFVAPAVTLGAAIDVFIQRRASSLFVAPQGSKLEEGLHLATESGIVTERDVLRAVATGGTAALDKRIGEIASRPLVTVPAEAFVYRAIGRMDRIKIRHLAVVDELGWIVGALSARDLLRLRARDAVRLGDEIDEAADIQSLGKAWAKLPAVARALLAEGVDALLVAGVISRELGALTRRAAILAEARMQETGLGAPPVPYAVLVLGSAGRGESLLALDQDNAIIFAEGDPDGPEDRWFAKLGAHIADHLHEVGVPYCKGGVMAKNAAWRGSAKLWRERIRDWVGRSNPEDLLAVDIFFDFRPVYGDSALAVNLWRDAYDLAKDQMGFAKLLAETAGPFESPVGFFGVRTENGRVDLKRGGLFGLVSTARALAIRHHVVERSTHARLQGVKALRVGAERDLDAMTEAYAVLVAAVLDQQLVDIAAGRPPSNAVEWRRLSRSGQEQIKKALGSLSYADEMVRDLLVVG